MIISFGIKYRYVFQNTETVFFLDPKAIDRARKAMNKNMKKKDKERERGSLEKREREFIDLINGNQIVINS